MITGDTTLAQGKRGAFYNTLEEFHKYWERVDIICPRVVTSDKLQVTSKEEQETDPEGHRAGLDALRAFDNVFIYSSPWPKIFQPFWILKMGLEIYKKNKFDVITVHEYPPFYNGIGAKMLWRKIKVPYILELMHVPGLPRAADAKESFYKLLTKLFFKYDAKYSKAIRIINRGEVLKFLTDIGIKAEKIKYIPAFYIDFSIFRPLNLEKKYDLILISRLEKNKGVNILLDIAQRSNLKMLIVGAGSLYNNLRSKISNLGLSNRVTLHGFAKDSNEIAKLINESRALIMLSYNEGGPRVILESLACGVPVIGTKVGIATEVINNNNGRIINWSATDAIEAFEDIKNLVPTTDISRFERISSIKNYAQEIQNLI